ncbi:MAG: cell division protein ZapA [Pseudomonadota bacterium]
MPEVAVDVAGRAYRLGCGEGEEAHLMRLAELVDAEAQRLHSKLGQMTEGRLMLMAALMLADRLSEAETARTAAERRAATAEKLAEARASSDLFGPERETEITETLDALAERIEALTGRVQETA